MATKRADRTGPARQQFEANRKIIFATESLCWICGQPVDKSLKSPHPMSKTVDHKIPINRGGHPVALDNLALAHRSCNRAKSDNLFYTHQKKEEKEEPKPKTTRDWRSF